MEPARLTELRLTDFKSFHDEVLPLGRLTVLIGGNAVGKSNALEGLYALARLAQGMTLREALSGSDQDPSSIRGGAPGCPPIGRDLFRLGCVTRADGAAYGLDIAVKTGHHLGLESETVSWPGGSVRDSRAGLPEGQDRLSTVPAALFPPEKSAPPEFAHRFASAHALISALLDVAPLDPDPQTMRGYSPQGNALLLPRASNLSSVIDTMRRRDRTAFARLEELVGVLSNGRITGLGLVETGIGDVQLMLKESGGDVPARLASDGTLRFLAFATAVLTARKHEDAVGPERLIVVEEIERGLYPAQARLLLELIDHELMSRAASVLLTTHSPALLSALPAEHHADVFVCSRDPNGYSRLTRLTDLPGYVELLAAGGLGEAVATDGLASARERQQGLSPEFLAFLESM